MSEKNDPTVVRDAMLKAGLEPLEPYQNALAKWKCKCLGCGEIVYPKYNQIQQGVGGCNRCGTKRGSNKIKMDSELAIQMMKDAGLEPLEDYVNSKTKWKCKCLSCGDIVHPKLNGIQTGEGGCYKCGMKKAGLSNTLDSEQAIKLVKAAGFTPLVPYINALTKWKMRHDVCNSIVYPKLNTISNNSSKTPGCAVCAGKQVEIGLNDLGSRYPLIAMEAAGWDPTLVTAGSNQKKLWKCNEGHKWIAPVAQRTSGHGCPSCSQSGFDPNKDGWLYFLSHPDWEMFQIGITNVPDDRLNSHRRLGWELIELRGPMDGHLIKQWETSILRMLKAKGVDLSNSKIAGKFDGYSEAWSKSTFEVKSIKDLMRLTKEFEENV
jgi:hypothetical protein